MTNIPVITVLPIQFVALARLVQQASPRDISLHPEKTYFFSAYLGDDLVGFSGLQFFGKHAEFVNAFVLPLYRGRGIHTAMLHTRRVAAVSHGAQFGRVHCNAASLGLYLAIPGATIRKQYKTRTIIIFPL